MSEGVIEFYNGQTVFLTGATGFIGKVLLEKLLRVCTSIPKIYVLVRPKKGKTRQQRFSQLFDSPCFGPLKSARPNFRDQVAMIEGDCDLPDLGIGLLDRQLLVSDVTMVIHAAANVKFDQDLKSAAANLKATISITELCKEMPKLQSYVYVSTAYSNCIHHHIEETFYEPPITSELLLGLLQSLDDAALQAITPGLLGPWPNTYVYMKCIIEDYLRRHCDGLPLAIVRPSIVVNAIQEPLPGWSDSLYGPSGIALGASLGVIRSVYVKKDAKADFVPLDSACNVVLLAGWKVGIEKQLKIFNAVTEEEVGLTWAEFLRDLYQDYWSFVPERQLWYNSLTMTDNKMWHDVTIFFGHTVVAHLVDAILFLLGRERLAVQNYSRLNKLLQLIIYFTTRSWHIDRVNVDRLDAELTEEERSIFRTSHRDMQTDSRMKEYRKASFYNHRVYILKDPFESLNRARVKLVVFAVLHYSFLAFLWYILYRVLLFFYSSVVCSLIKG